MFVQVIVAEDVDDDIVEVLRRWHEEVRPGAVGWLGGTGGVTSDGALVLAVRFGSEEEARRNSDRPEQGAWWAEAEKRLTGGVRFHDCDRVALVRGGGDDAAGFVQVMESRPAEPLDVDELAAEMTAAVEQHRPDVLGGLVASDGDRLFQVVYFTSEDEARRHEAEPVETDEEFEAYEERIGEVRYHDLPAPILLS
jgi:hypothetical protein